MTLIQAIIHVLRKKNSPLTPAEIFLEINNDNLYRIKSSNPMGIVRNQLYRHCVGVHCPTASKKRVVRKLEDGRYTLANPE